MKIHDMRCDLGLTQRQFAEKFHVPLQTLKQWECSPQSSSHREPPAYVVYMMERIMDLEHGAQAEDEASQTGVEAARIRDESAQTGHLIRAARHSRYNACHWFRYLRKEVDEEGRIRISPAEAEALLSGDDLTMFQKVSLRCAMQQDSPTNRYIAALNRRAQTPMMDQLLMRTGRANVE